MLNVNIFIPFQLSVLLFNSMIKVTQIKKILNNEISDYIEIYLYMLLSSYKIYTDVGHFKIKMKKSIDHLSAD